MSEWPKGTRVKHKILPGIYIVQGPAAQNEIGYALTPVLDKSNVKHWVRPGNLMKVGGAESVTVGERGHTPGDLPGLFARLL